LTFSEITVSVGFAHTSKLDISTSDELSIVTGLLIVGLMLRLPALLSHFLINEAPFFSNGVSGVLLRLYNFCAIFQMLFCANFFNPIIATA
jgi:hypothetical protein